MMELRLDEAEHRYSLGSGRVLPSVTQILEDVGIIDYSGIPEEARKAALRRGRIVHLATQFDDEYSIGRSKQPLDESSVSSEHMGYVGAWRNFRKDTGFVPELIEHRAYHPTYFYAGTVDVTGRFQDSPVVWVGDKKTGAAQWWVRIQVALYSGFFPHPRTRPRFCVELHSDETYEFFKFGENTWQRDFNRGLYALDLYNVKREKQMKD